MFTVAFIVRGNVPHLPLNAPRRDAFFGYPFGTDQGVKMELLNKLEQAGQGAGGG
jgi:hypothetical protein